MEQQMALYGVPSIVALLIIKEVFTFVRAKSGRSKVDDGLVDLQRLVDAVRRETHQLWVWHAPDSSGEQTWKNAQMIDLTKAMMRTVESNTKAFDRLSAMIEAKS